MSKSLKTVVIGTSLTDESDGVVRTAAALARATGASPWLVHAYVPSLPLAFPSGAGQDSRWVEEQVKSRRERLADQARRTGLIASAGSSTSPDQVRLVVGSPHREIVELARRVKADLIVVGAAEDTRGILGSTADRVIRKAPCPVLVVRSEAAFPPRRVEIPVDLSPASAKALRQGLGFLEEIGAPLAGVEVLFVLNPFEIGGSTHLTHEQVRRFAGEEVGRFLTANAPESAARLTTRLRTGYAREEILDALTARGAGLAVLGTHGRGGFERLMIGSVAAGVLRGARCNLLVVPPGASRQLDEAERRERAGADWSYVAGERLSILAIWKKHSPGARRYV